MLTLFQDLKEFIVDSLGEGWEEDRNSKSPCGIIYCRTRDGTEELAASVRKMGIRSGALTQSLFCYLESNQYLLSFVPSNNSLVSALDP